MFAEAPSKLLPRMILPFAQQWAERAGMTILARLLTDERFQSLVEQYGEELAQHFSKKRVVHGDAVKTRANRPHDIRGNGANGMNGHGSAKSSFSMNGHAGSNGAAGMNGHGYRESNTYAPDSPQHEGAAQDDAAPDLASLNARVASMESQHAAHMALFEVFRSKIRPLALALGRCPECLVGIQGCPTCGGRSKVGLFTPDQTLLQKEILTPLSAAGVPSVTPSPLKHSKAVRKKSLSQRMPTKKRKDHGRRSAR